MSTYIANLPVSLLKVDLLGTRRSYRMRKAERIPELLWRYRGVILVASIPVLLVAIIVLIVPRVGGPAFSDKPHTLKELQHKAFRYAVVIDAGSTGSRVHVFKFDTARGTLDLVSDTFEQLKPGLSSYADDPAKAADSLKPLLETAVKTVPKELQASTPVSVKATAGLRLLPEGKADKILSAVSEYLKKYPFKIPSGAVGILDGSEEGGFAWLTLNYLLGNLGKDPKETVTAIDLGGGSVQEAYAMPEQQAKSAPSGYIKTLKGGGKTYHVYVHSYLGFGLMAGRAAVIAQKSDAHPCFSSGFSNTYKYASKDYTVKAGTLGNFNDCQNVSLKALDLGKDCGAPKDQCSFNGAWRGTSTQERAFYVSSYFWDRAIDSGIIADKQAISFQITPKEFAKHASVVCGSPLDKVKQLYPSVTAEHHPYFCLDLTYCNTLLTKAFKLSEDLKVTLVKQVKYNGQNIEAAWPLGAAVNDLS